MQVMTPHSAIEGGLDGTTETHVGCKGMCAPVTRIHMSRFCPSCSLMPFVVREAYPVIPCRLRAANEPGRAPIRSRTERTARR